MGRGVWVFLHFASPSRKAWETELDLTSWTVDDSNEQWGSRINEREKQQKASNKQKNKVSLSEPAEWAAEAPGSSYVAYTTDLSFGKQEARVSF